jgi:hypothetical protein
VVTVAANFAEPDDLSDAMMDQLATLGPANGGMILPKAPQMIAGSAN